MADRVLGVDPILECNPLEANDIIYHTTGLGKLPHTILTKAADDHHERSYSGIDSVGMT